MLLSHRRHQLFFAPPRRNYASRAGIFLYVELIFFVRAHLLCWVLDAYKQKAPCRPQRPPCASFNKPEDDRDLEALMAEDLRAFKPSSMSQNGATPPGSGSSVARQLVDKVLVANFFFIIFILAWFGVGLGINLAFRSSTLLDLWYPLWPVLFQPALGVLMLGAIAQGVLNRKNAD